MKKILMISALLFFAVGKDIAQINVIHEFNDTIGAYPPGDLTLSGNVLYGMALTGGTGSVGCVFSIHTDGSHYKDLVDFDHTNGCSPVGSLTLVGKTLYGMTPAAGMFGGGNIFRIDTNGQNFDTLLNFDRTIGGQPIGSLTFSGKKLYGTTSGGGVNDEGVIFCIDTNGQNFKDLFDFGSLTAEEPVGKLLLNGKVLYGMTYGDITAACPSGNIFSIDTNGQNYKCLLCFNGVNGANPEGSLILSGKTLYGMAEFGGVADSGTIFSIDTNGNNYKDMFDFGNGKGVIPVASLTLSSLGTTLYGMTGGLTSINDGNIFSIDTNGSGYKELFRFDGIKGEYPAGSLTLSGSVLYGTAEQGGIYNYGVIFSMDTNLFTAVDKINKSSNFISVYPNPSSGAFTLQVESEKVKVESAAVEIYNVSGEKVYSQFLIPNSQFVIDISSQPNGVYLYRVIGEDGSLIGEGKLVIQK